MTGESLTTDRDAYLPWLGAPPAAEPDEWHVVVAWFHEEPERLAQSAVVEKGGS